MQDYLNLLGLEANWLPALLGLVGLPLLYASLATNVHREYASLVKDAAEGAKSLPEEEMAKLIKYIEDKIQIFQLDWWVVGAFGVLLFAIMNCGNVQTLCWSVGPAVSPGAVAGGSIPLCSASFNEFYEKPVRAAMAVYGSLFAVLIGFRLIWARVELARETKSYYACGFKIECVSEPPFEERTE